MTRRRSKQDVYRDAQFRAERISKLIRVGWIKDENEIPDDAIPVDPDVINLGGSYFHPTFFQDQPFKCEDCGSEEVWKAGDQVWYFESSHAPYYSRAIRCRPCRTKEEERKSQARIDAGHEK